MERVFADTAYWVALLVPRDQLYHKAIAASSELKQSRIVTSEMVLTEVLNRFSDSDSHLRQAAAKFVESLYQSPGAKVVPQTSQLFARALRRYQTMADKRWSFTDCASFIIMEDEGLTKALTEDRHFVQAGFQALLG